MGDAGKTLMLGRFVVETILEDMVARLEFDSKFHDSGFRIALARKTIEVKSAAASRPGLAAGPHDVHGFVNVTHKRVYCILGRAAHLTTLVFDTAGGKVRRHWRAAGSAETNNNIGCMPRYGAEGAGNSQSRLSSNSLCIRRYHGPSGISTPCRNASISSSLGNDISRSPRVTGDQSR